MFAKVIPKKKFVKVDGKIESKDTTTTGLISSLLGGAIPPAKLEWVPGEEYIKVSNIESLKYHEYDILMPRPNVPLHPVLRNANEEAPNANEEAPNVYAPNGWWVTVGFLNSMKTYHLADPNDGIAIAATNIDEPIAEAIQQMAIEIAYKPGNQNGSMVRSDLFNK